MAGPNLELFKFGLYVFFPVAIMIHYGDPDWYTKYVLPYRDRYWPPKEATNQPPSDREDIRASLEQLRQERLDKRQARLEKEALEARKRKASTE